MKDILEKYAELKDEIHTHGSQKSDEDFIKLVTLKNEDDELKETLILLHTNYKNEIQDLRSNRIKVLNKLIDLNVALIHKLEDLVEEGEKSNAKTQRTFKIHNIERLLLVIVFVIFAFWTMSTINGDAFQGSIGAIDRVFGNITGNHPTEQQNKN